MTVTWNANGSANIADGDIYTAGSLNSFYNQINSGKKWLGGFYATGSGNNGAGSYIEMGSVYMHDLNATDRVYAHVELATNDNSNQAPWIVISGAGWAGLGSAGTTALGGGWFIVEIGTQDRHSNISGARIYLTGTNSSAGAFHVVGTPGPLAKNWFTNDWVLFLNSTVGNTIPYYNHVFVWKETLTFE